MFKNTVIFFIASSAIFFSGAALSTTQASTIQNQITTLEEEKELIVFSSGSKKIKNERQQRPKKENIFRCNNDAAQILYRAGFRGWSHKMAWAITYRESKHQNLSESSRYYTGALGYWQVQTSAHSSKPWWSRSAMLDPQTQSSIVYRYMTNRGTNWVPWGLNPDGSLNTTHYRGWSSWQHENWIMKPFRTGLALYPCKMLP
jgi:hypothetical protein